MNRDESPHGAGESSETTMAARVVTKVLRGHTSEETAFLVDDYPYGRTVRCRIRYWLEYSARKGYRMVSQTENPKTGAWNKPRKGTYSLISEAMYLDEQGHVQGAVVTEYTEASEALIFAREFVSAASDSKFRERLAMWAAKKAAYAQGCADGRIVFTINGVKQPWTEAEIARLAADAVTWREVLAVANPDPPVKLTAKGGES